MLKFGNNISNHNFNPKGPAIHFLTGRVGWWDLSGGMPKNMALEAGPGKKILGVKGESTKKFFQVLQWWHLW